MLLGKYLIVGYLDPPGRSGSLGCLLVVCDDFGLATGPTL